MCGHTRDPIIYSNFHRNPCRGFGTPGSQNLAFPITLASRFYNRLYYRTSRDCSIIAGMERPQPSPTRGRRRCAAHADVPVTPYMRCMRCMRCMRYSRWPLECRTGLGLGLKPVRHSGHSPLRPLPALLDPGLCSRLRP